MLSAKDVAEYFLSLVNEEEGDFITNLKLQKLLYYAQGFSLALNAKLFPEKIMAWTYGPVVEEVYRYYKACGASPLPVNKEIDGDKYSAEEKSLLDEVYQVYGQFSPSALVRMTHSEPPWKNTEINEEIKDDVMREYFITQIN